MSSEIVSAQAPAAETYHFLATFVRKGIEVVSSVMETARYYLTGIKEDPPRTESIQDTGKYRSRSIRLLPQPVPNQRDHPADWIYLAEAIKAGIIPEREPHELAHAYPYSCTELSINELYVKQPSGGMIVRRDAHLFSANPSEEIESAQGAGDPSCADDLVDPDFSF